MLSRTISAFLVAVGLSLSGYFIADAITTAKSADRYVTVKGLAEKVVKANEAIWIIRFTYASDDLSDLYQGINQSKQKILTFLQNKGFQNQDIELESVSLVDNQTNTYSSNQTVKRFVATTGVKLRTKLVDQVQKAAQDTSELVQNSVIIQNSDVQYYFTELNAIKPAMLDEATHNAKLAAETFAKNSHSKLGNIRHASQGLFSISDTSNGYSSSIIKKVRVVSSVQYYLR